MFSFTQTLLDQRRQKSLQLSIQLRKKRLEDLRISRITVLWLKKVNKTQAEADVNVNKLVAEFTNGTNAWSQFCLMRTSDFLLRNTTKEMFKERPDDKNLAVFLSRLTEQVYS
jgi:hypothetical protein